MSRWFRASVLVLLVLLVLFLSGFESLRFLPRIPSVSGLSGWNYEEQLDITGATGAGTNYQFCIHIYRGWGINNDNTLYLRYKNESTFPNDLNFTDNDKTTPLDYWIEHHNSSYARVWVEVQDDCSSNQVIYFYYGKSGITTTRDTLADGEATFPFFDDFEDGSVDSDKWITGGSVAESSGYIQCGPGVDSYAYQNTTTYPAFSRPHALRHKGLVETADSVYSYMGFRVALTGNWMFCPHSKEGYYTYNGTGQTTDDDAITSYHTYDILWSSANVKYYKDGTLKATHTNPPSDNMRAYMRAYTTSEHTRCEFMFVRKYVSPEPQITWVDPESPQYQNVGTNTTDIDQGDTILFYGEGKDNYALNWMWFSSNESGTWKNYTDYILNTTTLAIDMVDCTIADWIVSPINWWGISALRLPTGELKKYNGVYWAAYAAWASGDQTNAKIGLMNSTDLQSWVDWDDNPVLTKSGSGWEYEDFGVCDFLYMNGLSKPFWLFYSAKNSTGKGTTKVGVAYSNSSFTFTKESSNPIFQYYHAQYSPYGIENFQVQQMTDDNWIAAFECEGLGDVHDARVGLAKSTATYPNASWNFMNRTFSDPASGHDREVNPTLMRKGNDYYIYYEDFETASEIVVSLQFAREDYVFLEDRGWRRWNNNPVYDPAYNVAPDLTLGWEGNYYYSFAKNLSASPYPLDLLRGSFRNYESPMDMGKSRETWVPCNFTWCNSSVTGTVGWKRYWNDTYGNINGTSTYTFTSTPTNQAPTIDSLRLSTTLSDTNITSISVDVYYEWEANITDTDGISNIKNVTIRIENNPANAINEDTPTYTSSTEYWFLYDNSTGSETWEWYNGTDWCTTETYLNISGCISPSGTNGWFKFNAKLSKIASHNATWDFAALVYDNSEATDTDHFNSITIAMYTEITVVATHTWSNVNPGTANVTVDGGTVQVNITANAAIDLQAKGDGDLTFNGNTIPLENVLIHKDTLATAIALTTSYQDIPSLTNLAAGENSHTFVLWLTVPNGTDNGSYSYTLTIQCVEHT